MKPSKSTKPISYLKAHTSEALQHVSETRRPLVITQNGYAKAIVQDLESYEETQESLALLKIIAHSKRSAESKKPRTAKQAFAGVRRRAREFKERMGEE